MNKRSVTLGAGVLAVLVAAPLPLANAAHTRSSATLNRTICSKIGGSWQRSTSECDINGVATASNFTIPAGTVLVVMPGGTLNVPAGVTVTDSNGNTGISNSGTINVAGTVVEAAGEFYEGGNLNVSSAGTLQVQAAGTLYDNDASFSNAGTVSDSGTTVMYAGTFTNSGSFNISHQLTVNGATFINSASGTLTNTSNSGVNGLGAIFFTALDNFGLVDNQAPGGFYIGASGFGPAGVTNEANAQLTNETGATFTNDETITNYGTISNAGSWQGIGTCNNTGSGSGCP